MSIWKNGLDSFAWLAHLTLERLSDVTVWMDADGCIQHVNGAVRQFGYEPDELVGRSVSDLLPERVRGEFDEAWAQLRGKRALHLQGEWTSKDNQVVPVEISANLIEFEGEEFVCSFVRDVSERQRREAVLRESEEQYRNLVEMANDGIIIVQDDVIRYLNPRFTSIFGITADLHARFPLEELIHPEERASTLERYRLHCVGRDVPSMYESAMLHRDGHKVPVEINVGAVPWQGRPALIFEIRDITERKKGEQELREALRQVEQLKNRLEAENVYLQQEIKLTHNFEEIISRTEIFRSVLRKVEQVASTDATVLILGETGTGKELVARAIHDISRRKERPLVKVNCAALPENLVESELFGHEKGAFTGALVRKVGRFELADGGTIFLDEIGDLPLDLQVKLLRVLQDGEFERLGNPSTVKVDVRVIAATNRDLEGALGSGLFRRDLYYRLNVFPIHVPPLRDRKDDIPLLVQYFVRKYAAKIGKKITSTPQSTIDRLLAYDWPGNVRELEHIIERAVILSQGDVLEVEELLSGDKGRRQLPEGERLEKIEKEHIVKVLRQTGWRVSGERGAAKILDMNPQTLFSRMKKLGIRRPGQ